MCVLHVIAKHNNICKHIHLPYNQEVTEFEMNRLHTREEYMTLIDKIES
jgi:tRNA-2-methylthio-N6-dimethylallyladenosine synthase